MYCTPTRFREASDLLNDDKKIQTITELINITLPA